VSHEEGVVLKEEERAVNDDEGAAKDELIALLTEKLENVQKDYAAMKETCPSRDTTIIHLSTDFIATEAENNVLRKESAAHEEEKRVLRDEIDEKNEMIDCLFELLDEKDSELADKGDRLDALTRETDSARRRMLRGQVASSMRDEFRIDIINAMRSEDNRDQYKRQEVHDIFQAIASAPDIIDWQKLPYKLREIETIDAGLMRISKDRLPDAHPTQELVIPEQLKDACEDTVEYICRGEVSNVGKQRMLEYKGAVQACAQKENERRDNKKRNAASISNTNKKASQFISTCPSAKRQRTAVDIESLLDAPLSSSRSKTPEKKSRHHGRRSA